MLPLVPATRSPRFSVCALTLILIAAAGVRSANAQTKEQDEPNPRGAIFATLETSYIGLQALDIASTLRGFEKGYVEANPVMGGPTGHPAAFVAVKAASTAGTIFLARRLAGRNRVAGIMLMAALDGAYSVIAGRNFALMASHTLR